MGAETSPEQQYALRWNDFHSNMLSSFRHLRDEEDFVDVTLACDGCSFTAHKVVLSACSPYFRKLLKANPCQHPIVILKDVKSKDMENLLRFMYNGEVNISHEHLTDFLKTAQMLQVRGLADVPSGASTMGQRLTSTNTEEKISPNTSSSLPWSTEKRDYEDRGTNSPPTKRPRQGEATPDRGRSPSRGNGDMQESLLGQALEAPTPKEKLTSELSLQAHSTGEDSNSSDTAMSDQHDTIIPKTEMSDYPMLDDHNPYNTNGGLMDQNRPQSFPGALLGLQGLGGLLPGPSGMHGNPDSFGAAAQLRLGNSPQSSKPQCPQCHRFYSNICNLRQHIKNVHGYPKSEADFFTCEVCGKKVKTEHYLMNHQLRKHVSRRSLDMMRVRATDPRPCPKCGKIYRSAHTLRTHLEDKHTICPGYRCVLCGTVAKSRNSLHSHMSRQHRGISTKDLPVVPMPAPFDPELASKLLAKAGVKISAAELRARASPTGPRRSDVKLDAKSAFSGGVSEGGSSICGDNDPEDLTTSTRYGGLDLGMSPPLNHQNHYKFNRYGSGGQAVAAKSVDSIAQNMSKEPYPGPLPPAVSAANTTGSAILDTYIQLITENSLGMGMMQEQAAAAVHAAKLAHLNAMGLDKASQHHFLEKMQQQMQTANDYLMKRNEDIRRNDTDVKMERDEGESSGGEDEEYSDEDAEPEQLKASD